MSDGVAHLAGPDIRFNTEEGQVLRQRCSWCGATLIDVNLSRIAVPVGQEEGPYPTWPIGSFVETHSPDGRGGAWFALDWEHPAPVPDHACLRMPLEVTG